MENAQTSKREEWFNRNYKKLLVIPAILLILSLYYVFNTFQETGDIIHRDITLTGGTSVTILGDIDKEGLESFISGKFDDYQIKEVRDLATGKRDAVIVDTNAGADETKDILEEFLGYELNEENSSIEFTGAVIGQGFYQQLRIAILFAFVLMSIVIFIIFRTFVPSLAVILAAFADIVMTLGIIDFVGIRISGAGIVALLMLIGYSVDSDILLTSRVLRSREDSVNERILSAFKTGMLMTLAALGAVIVALIIVYRFSDVLTQIFGILTIGLLFDIINTWITNVGILKMYVERKSPGEIK
ncbi:protein translocase subunit SecF [Candidatus Pacearchaeota archaeon]|nr:protein translocase subunit SecF [Candidatus Pacearchaeota archaeon]